MRFRTCGDSGVLVELADLDETLRVFAALRSSEAAGIPGSNALDAVTQLIPAARTILISFDPLQFSLDGRFRIFLLLPAFISCPFVLYG